MSEAKRCCDLGLVTFAGIVVAHKNVDVRVISILRFFFGTHDNPLQLDFVCESRIREYVRAAHDIPNVEKSSYNSYLLKRGNKKKRHAQLHWQAHSQMATDEQYVRTTYGTVMV